EGPAEALVVIDENEFERTRHVAVRTRHRVEALHPRRCRLVARDLESGEAREERFDKFILAVGARARWPGVPGEEAPNVFPVRRLDDAAGIRAVLDREAVRHAVIVGGGYVGLEMAEALRARGVRVTILEATG